MAHSEATDFLQKHPNVTTIELLISDLNGVLRGKHIDRDLLEKIFTKGFYLPGSVMSLDATGTTVESAGLGMDVGDRDRLCKPIAGTLQLVPWHENGDRAQVLCTMFAKQEAGFFADPRQILQSAVKRFDTLGFKPGIALELEFYLVDVQRGEKGELMPPKVPGTERRMESCQVYSIDDLADTDFFIRDVVATARAQNVPADTVIAEYAPGQFEVNLNYGNDIMAAADNAVLLKHVIANVAKKYDMEATFMAKPYIAESGSGLHMHLSLLDEAGNNIFAANDSSGEQPNDPTKNAYMRNAVAGLISMADCTQAFLAPNINSYRRLAPDGFAPTSKTWGFDNRTVALRIPAGGKDATRIEHRVSGADCNPYLATTVLLAGVVEGIQNNLQPPEPTSGNAYEQGYEQIADNQRDALRNMVGDERVTDWFGADFVELYQTCKWHDLRMFEQQVTQMEYDLLLPYV